MTEEQGALKDAITLLEHYSVRRILGAAAGACKHKRRDATRDGFRTLAERWDQAAVVLSESWPLAVGPALHSNAVRAELDVLRVLSRCSLCDLLGGPAGACQRQHERAVASGDDGAGHWARNAKLLESLCGRSQIRQAM